MNTKLKKSLYEKIMRNVSKEVKKTLNESRSYKYFPKTRKELEKIINEHFAAGNRDLNDIDVSKITNFANLFDPDSIFGESTVKVPNGSFDVSKWDVSNGKRFDFMFSGCKNFNCDLSLWNVSNGLNFEYMFAHCDKLKVNFGTWDFSSAKNVKEMFYKTSLKYVKLSVSFSNGTQNGILMLMKLLNGAYCTGAINVDFSVG